MSQTAIERHDHWRVTVETGGEHIVSIEPKMLAGREPSEADYDAIRTAAHHLLSFAASAVDPYDFRCEECDCRSFAIVQGSNGKPTAAIRCVECKRVYNIYAPTALHAKAGVSVEGLALQAVSHSTETLESVLKSAFDEGYCEWTDTVVSSPDPHWIKSKTLAALKSYPSVTNNDVRLAIERCAALVADAPADTPRHKLAAKIRSLSFQKMDSAS